MFSKHTDLQDVCSATVLPFMKLQVQSSFSLPAQHLSFEPYRQTFLAVWQLAWVVLQLNIQASQWSCECVVCVCVSSWWDLAFPPHISFPLPRLDRLDIRYTFLRVYWFPERRVTPGSYQCCAEHRMHGLFCHTSLGPLTLMQSGKDALGCTICQRSVIHASVSMNACHYKVIFPCCLQWQVISTCI